MVDVTRTWGQLTWGADLWGAAYVPSNPTALVEVWTPTGWQDVTCDVRSIEIQRGRQSWSDAFAAGTLRMAMANFTGYYSAWNPHGVWASASPYRTDVPIRVSVLPAGSLTRSTLFTGTTDQVTDSWPQIVDALATIDATDAFKQLARHTGLVRATVGDGELSGARVNRLLDDAGYTGVRKVDAGLVTLQPTNLSGLSLDLLRQVGESEWGWLFVDETGAVVFRQRDAVQTDPRMTAIQWTFTDQDNSPVGVCYSDIALPTSDDEVVNVAQVTPPGVATQTAQDANSVTWFGPRTWTKTDLPLKQASDALGLAQLVVLEQANYERRVEGITFDVRDAAGYAAALGVRINDRIRVVRHYPNGYVLDAQLLVQSIHHSITANGTPEPDRWTVQLGTFSALNVNDYGQWDGPAGAGIGGWDVDQWGV
jgi:hypothetical protein